MRSALWPGPIITVAILVTVVSGCSSERSAGDSVAIGTASPLAASSPTFPEGDDYPSSPESEDVIGGAAGSQNADAGKSTASGGSGDNERRGRDEGKKSGASPGNGPSGSAASNRGAANGSTQGPAGVAPTGRPAGQSDSGGPIAPMPVPRPGAAGPTAAPHRLAPSVLGAPLSAAYAVMAGQGLLLSWTLQSGGDPSDVRCRVMVQSPQPGQPLMTDTVQAVLNCPPSKPR